MDIMKCAFFGHRDFSEHLKIEEKLSVLIKRVLKNSEYVEFCVGRNGEFDKFVSSVILRVRKEYGEENSVLILNLPYCTADYINNRRGYEDFYDEIRICEKASNTYFKSAIQIRNREMVDYADIIICYVERKTGGAYNAIKYAEKQGKTVINLASDDELY